MPEEASALPEAWLLLGEAHEMQGEGQQAMLAYGEALRSAAKSSSTANLDSAHAPATASTAATARRRRGALLEMSNEREAALREYEQGVQQVATDADLWYNMGYLHLTASDNAMALRCFATCCRLNASHALGHEGLGTAIFAMGAVRTAVSRFARALALAPSRVLARQNLAAALGKLAMDRDSSYLESAVGAYDRLLQVLPSLHTRFYVFSICITLSPRISPRPLKRSRTHARRPPRQLVRTIPCKCCMLSCNQVMPDSADAVAKKVMIKGQLCDWRSMDSDVAILVRLTQGQLGIYQPESADSREMAAVGRGRDI